MPSTAFNVPVVAAARMSHRVTTTCTLRPEEPTVARRSFLQGVVRLSAATATTLFSLGPRCSLASTQPGEADPSLVDKAVQVVGDKRTKLKWGYSGLNGPEHWAELNEEWAVCACGQLQSPIAVSYKDAKLATDADPRPVLSVARGARFVVKRKEPTPLCATKWMVVEPLAPPPPAVIGDAPPVDVVKPTPAATITVPGLGRYRFKSLHFHTDGSEHVLNGVRSEMECHLVFPLDKADDGVSNPPNHIVVGVLINEEEQTSSWIDACMGKSVRPFNDDVDGAGTAFNLDLETVLPDFNASNMYTYPGSLTTPPGTEGIYWILMNQRASVSREDRYLLEDFQGGPNTRPLQEANGRPVTQFPAVVSEMRPKTAMGA